MLDVSDVSTQIGEFQRDYLYKIQVISFPALLSARLSGASKIAENLDLLAKSTPLPEMKTKPIKLMWGGGFGFWSGPNDSSGQVQWTFNVPASYGALSFFENWRDLNGDPETGLAYPKNQCLGVFKMLMVDLDKTTVLQAYTLKNANVFGVDSIDFKKDGGDIQSFKVTINFEKRAVSRNNLGNV